MTEACIVITTCGSEETALTIASGVVDQGFAACVNILPRVQSVYRWQGAVESASEIPLLIKSTVGRYAELEAAIRARHPYDVPEIIALPITQGLPAYLNWVATETAA